MIVKNVAGRAEFSSAKMGKVSLGAGAHLYAGLNCFLPGQEHQAHVHIDQDKMYVVMAGCGEARVGDEVHAVEPGDLILATAGVVHGLKNTGTAPFSVLVVFGPPPQAK
ncbi:MAG TPA: cupin domain-containing protein [Paludibaculum sp.]|jgi:quercetin dioxygenase-like cupin family protein